MTRVRAVALALCLSGLAGCGSSSSEAESEPAREPETSPERRHVGSATEHVQATATERALATLVRSSGEVRRSGGAPEAGAELDAGERIEVAAGGTADIDLRDGDRLSVVSTPGNALSTDLRIGDAGPASAWVVSGAVHMVAPAGTGPRPPLRVATPVASIELSVGEALVVVHATGATWVVALGGPVAITNGESAQDSAGRRRVRELSIVPGQAVLVTQRVGEATVGPSTLDAALVAAATLFAEVTPVEPARAARDLRDAANRLDEALGWLEAEQRHGHELTSQHRDAVRASRSDEAMRLQRELVRHAQVLHALRSIATSRWERVRVQSLARPPTAEGADPAASRHDRVASLLGFAE